MNPTTNPPTNANEDCVGPDSESAGNATSCAGCPNQSACASGSGKAKLAEVSRDIKQGLKVKQILLVLSGKGGVGKSTVACQLAQSLSSSSSSNDKECRVGVLDVDICGPSVPRMLLGDEVHRRQVHRSGSGWSPVYVHENLAVMSISFLLPDRDAAVVWRGPRKNGLIQQFLCETDWGCDADDEEDYLDYLIIDTPPGTSDEHISTVQYLMAGFDNQCIQAIVVTTAEEASLADVRKELNFCQKTKLPVLGIIENMASFEAPLQNLNFVNIAGEDCTKQAFDLIRSQCPQLLNMNIKSPLFSQPSTGGIKTLVERYKTKLLGTIPMDLNLLKACEDGLCFVDAFQGSPAASSLLNIVQTIQRICDTSSSINKSDNEMDAKGVF